MDPLAVGSVPELAVVVISAIALCCTTGVALKNASFCVVAVPSFVPVEVLKAKFTPSARVNKLASIDN